MNIAAVAQTVRTANDLTIRSYLNASENGSGNELQLHGPGVGGQPIGVGGSRPSGP